jgi:hypothetical protein
MKFEIHFEFRASLRKFQDLNFWDATPPRPKGPPRVEAPLPHGNDDLHRRWKKDEGLQGRWVEGG